MVFEAVASDSKVMPSYFIQAVLKRNTREYLNNLIDSLLSRKREKYEPNEVMLVQESARAHGSKTVQTYVKENLPMFVPKDIRASSSPDLVVCDFSVFSVI